jgi:hypothetical protein
MQPLAEEFEHSTQHPLMPNMNMLPTPTSADPYFMNHSTAFPRQPVIFFKENRKRYTTESLLYIYALVATSFLF